MEENTESKGYDGHYVVVEIDELRVITVCVCDEYEEALEKSGEHIEDRRGDYELVEDNVGAYNSVIYIKDPENRIEVYKVAETGDEWKGNANYDNSTVQNPNFVVLMNDKLHKKVVSVNEEYDEALDEAKEHLRKMEVNVENERVRLEEADISEHINRNRIKAMLQWSNGILNSANTVVRVSSPVE